MLSPWVHHCMFIIGTLKKFIFGGADGFIINQITQENQVLFYSIIFNVAGRYQIHCCYAN